MGKNFSEQYRADFINVIKRQLGAAIRAKGGTVNDTDTWSAFVSAVNGIVTGKKWASGTLPNQTNISSDVNGTISGLLFSPKMVYIYCYTSYGSRYAYAYKSSYDGLAGSGDNVGGTSMVYPTNLKSDGFDYTYKVYSAPNTFTSVKWYAFE
ncbi:MAG: hypothetical protein K6T39_00240 [Anoxybacillus ayderensis]|nr:hypothetical protein [Anoxybacillus ayderensis]